MTKLFYLTAIFLTTWSLDQWIMMHDKGKEPSTSAIIKKTDLKEREHSIPTGNLLTLSDAEKIMGESLHLTDSATKRTEDVLTYQCAYKADKEDMKSRKTGAIYFLFEEYDRFVSAQKKYSFIKTANRDHGIIVLNNMGDEAYFHSDNQNFYFLMVRKGKKVFSMKVNKITSTASLNEFNRVVKKITDAI